MEKTCRSLQDTLNELMMMKIVPILNGNDATAKTVMDADLQGVWYNIAICSTVFWHLSVYYQIVNV